MTRVWWDVGVAIDRDDVIAASWMRDAEPHLPVEVWSLPERRRLGRIEAAVDIGGSRVGLVSTQDQLIVVTAAYSGLGVAGFDGRTGERLWHRRELRGGQQVASAGNAVVVSFERGSAHVIDGRTGVSVATLRGPRSTWWSRHRPVGLAARYGQLTGVDTTAWASTWRLEIAGFAVLDAAFSRDRLVASDVVDLSAGTEPSKVYCLDERGAVLWTHASEPDVNCPALGWDEEAGEWLGVETHVNRARRDTLIRWSNEGAVRARLTLRNSLGRYWFLPGGRRLITDRGEVIDPRTGQTGQPLEDGDAAKARQ